MVSSGLHGERGPLKEARPAAEIAMSSCWREFCREERAFSKVPKGSRKGAVSSLTSLTRPLSPSAVGLQVLQRPYSLRLQNLIGQLNPGR